MLKSLFAAALIVSFFWLFSVDTQAQNVYNKHGQFQGRMQRGPNGTNFYGRYGQFQGHMNRNGNFYNKHNQFQGRFQQDCPFQRGLKYDNDKRFPQEGFQGHRHGHGYGAKKDSQIWKNDGFHRGNSNWRGFGTDRGINEFTDPWVRRTICQQDRNGRGPKGDIKAGRGKQEFAKRDKSSSKNDKPDRKPS